MMGNVLFKLRTVYISSFLPQCFMVISCEICVITTEALKLMFLGIKVSPILFLKYYSCLHSDIPSYVKEKVVQGLHTGVY